MEKQIFKWKKRLLAGILTMAMILTGFPVQAFASAEMSNTPGQTRNIDVWDFGGVLEEDSILYTNHISGTDWDNAQTVGSNGLFTEGTTNFGDLTLTHTEKDRLYAPTSQKSYSTSLSNYAKIDYQDGYQSNGVYYCNGTGGEDRRNITLDNVQAGDKIQVYMSSSNSADGTFHFKYLGEDGIQDNTAAISKLGQRSDFIAEYSGSYKIYADTTNGLKPVYARVVRIPSASITGTIQLGDLSSSNLTLSFVNTKTDKTYPAQLEADGTFSASLPSGEDYNAVLGGVVDYGITSDTMALSVSFEDSVNGKSNVVLKVEQKDLVQFTGQLKGFDENTDLSQLKVTLVPTDSTKLPISLSLSEDLSYDTYLEKGVEYTVQLAGVNDYDPDTTSIQLSENAETNILVQKKPIYTVKGSFLGLGDSSVTELILVHEDGYRYSASVKDNTYEISLRDGVYTAEAAVEGYRTITHVIVSGKDITRDLKFSPTSDTTPELEWKSDIYVGYPDKADNYATVQEAMNACEAMNPSNEDQRITVHIAPGTYREQISIQTPYITLINDEPENGEVKLTWYYGIGYQYYSVGEDGYYDEDRAYDQYEKKSPAKWGVATYITADAIYFRAENIVFESSFNRELTQEELDDGVEPDGTTIDFERTKGSDVTSKAATERAAAIAVEANYTEFYNCKFLSSQDTLYTANETHGYFKNCFIEGNTDYIYGGGDYVFYGCTLSTYGYTDRGSGAYITASRNPVQYGYLFNNCTITSVDGRIVDPGYFGRPWGQDANVTFYNTILDDANLITPEGWTSMSGNTPENASYKEYNTTLADGTPVDTSNRISGTVMTEEDAANVNLEGYFGNWKPYYYYGDVEQPEQPREWNFIRFGSGAKGTLTKNDDGTLRINEPGGKIADSEDAMSLYYTVLDAKSENFTLTATFTVTGGEFNNGTYGDNQTGFGVIAMDTIPETDQAFDARYFNSASACVAKFVNKDLGKTGYRIAGGKLVTGYTDPTGTTGADENNIRNMDNKNAFDWDMDPNLTEGRQYTLTLRKSNTGYHAILNNDTENQIIFWGPEKLMVQDGDHIYVGFFAGRKIQVDISDIEFTVISPEEDEDPIPEPIEELEPSITINTPSTIGTPEYPFQFTSNVNGTLSVTDEQGTQLINQLAVTKQEYLNKVFQVKEGTSTFTVTFTPSSEEENLTSYDPIEKKISVTYRSITADTIYVSPNGSTDGTGTIENPMDVYTAVSYAHPGQTIVMLEGTYALTKGITVERGHNGTKDAPIIWTADENAAVTIDLSNSTGGINLSADYWTFYGMEVCKAPYGVKPFHVQGNYNTVEYTSIHDNGDSGLQISGFSDEPFDMWPEGNLIKYCEAYNNCDKTANDADGFAAKLTCGEGNVFDGCISHHNIDDGWDLYAKSTTGSIGAVTVKNCVAYSNGYLKAPFLADPELDIATLTGEGNGFKLGGESMPGKHRLENSISFNNLAKGITSNSCPDDIIINCTSYANATKGAGSVENVSLYTNAKITNYQVSGLISSMPSAHMEDKRDVKGQESLDSENNYFFNGTQSVNSLGQVFDPAEMFVSTDMTIEPTLTKNGIDMHGLLELNEKAPKNAGAVLKLDSEIPATPSIIYSTHVQNIGWMDDVTDGTLSGTTGRNLRLEAIRIQLENVSDDSGISYATHVQNLGWMDAVSNGALSGTTGKNLRLEAIRMNLTGSIAEQYDIYYRTHVQNLGWMGWAKNGENSGSKGLSLRLEAIEIRLVEKGSEAPGSTENAFAQPHTPSPSISYRTHVQNTGWMNAVTSGNTSGTTGKNLRLEAIQINLNTDGLNGDLSYRTHVQNTGWTTWTSNGKTSGTTGKNLRLEAIQIKLTGEIANQYTISYRTHVQNKGWMDWTSDGKTSGTTGESLRLEAIQIKLIRK